MSKEQKAKTIFRVDKVKGYSIVDNTAANDTRLSYGAIGVMYKALTKPDDLKFYIQDFSNTSSDGITKVSRYFKELRLAGYFELVKVRNELGQIIDSEYVVHEKPLHTNPIKGSKPKTKNLIKGFHRNSENPISGNNNNREIQESVNVKLLNTDNILNTDNNKILKENEKKLMLPLEEENKLSLSNLKTKFIETLKANGLEYNPGVKDSRFNYFSLNENNITPQELIDLIPKLIHVKKDNPTDKFFNGICWNMSDLISYKAKINNAYKPKVREFKKPEIKSEPVKFSESHLDTLKEFLA